MYIKNQIFIYDFVWAISEAVDLISPLLHGHHKQVTYISGSIAREMGLSDDDIENIILASMLHDIGAFSLKEWGMILSFEANGFEIERHAFLGYELLKDFEPLTAASELIKYHHADYGQMRHDIPVGSFIIHLANKISFLFDENSEILNQVPRILEDINQNRDALHPDVLTAFERLAEKEYFWIEASSSSLICADMLKRIHLSKELIDVETFRGFSKIAARIIDFRNRFTATHSSGVAAVAMELASLSGVSENECKMMEIAGYLHDLGKLSVPNEILEKNGPLDTSEYNVIRKHTYYTHAILSRLRGLEHVAAWAAYHHERLDGNGYPFHVDNRHLSKLPRIMAVSDVMTALTEDRPYRKGMNRDNTEKVLWEMVKNNGLDGDFVVLVNDNFPHINDARIEAQRKALKDYESFSNSIHIKDNA